MTRSVEFPVLNDVKGAFDIVSTDDISASCNTFGKLAPGAGGQIQGTYNCKSNNANANNDTSSGSDGSSGGGSSGNGSGNNGNSAAGLTINTAAVLGLAVAGVLFTL